MNTEPSGTEREVKHLGGASIDGAPIAYVVVFAAIVTALSFVPFSIELGGGGAFPLSQAVLPLSGIVLGPIAGAIANGIGTLLAIFVAPHTAGSIPLVTVFGNMFNGFVAGTFIIGSKRSKWWIGPLILSVVGRAFQGWLAITQVQVSVRIFLLFMIIIILAWVLFILPTRKLFSKWLKSANLGLVAASIFFIIYITRSVESGPVSAITYYVFAWPEEVFAMLIPIMPFEMLLRCIVGSVIGTGVIAGIRAIGLVKPKWASF